MKLKPKIISTAIMSSLMLMPYAVLAEEDTVDTGKMTVTGILPDRLEAVPGSFDIIDEEDSHADSDNAVMQGGEF